MEKFLFSIAILLSINLNAQIDTLDQSVISSSGDTLKSDSYILQYTIGEVVIETFSENGKILSQGFHQPDDIIISIHELAEFGNEIVVYPNPTADEIQLAFQLSQPEKVEVTLLEITGTQLKNNLHTIFSESITVDIRDYPSGQYLLVVTSLEKQKRQAYKIIKQ